jgi:hypothetical protein
MMEIEGGSKIARLDLIISVFLPINNIMPIHCPVKIEPLSTEAFRELDYQVMR